MQLSTSNCTYSLIEDRIHFVLIHSATRQTVEDLFHIFEDAVTQYPDRETLYLLDASNSDELPYRYLLQRAQQWTKAHPDIPPNRTAVIYRKGILTSMLDVLMKQLHSPKSKTRFFFPENHDEAVQWLLSDIVG